MRAWTCLALLLAAPAAAKDRVEVRTNVRPEHALLNFLLFPYAAAYALPHRGFEPHPYKDEGYGEGLREIAADLRTSAQAVGGRGAQHFALRVRGSNRLGWRAAASRFDRGFFGEASGLYTGVVTANYLQDGRSLLEFGLGLASFQEDSARMGVSAELAFESFPRRPWTGSARWQAALLRRDVWNEVAVEAGACWKRLGVYAGWRSLFNPLRGAHGPELAVRAWF